MRRLGEDRGSMSLFVVVIGLGLLVMIGLVVDGGGKIRATQRADAAAAEAARAGGQAINKSDAVRGFEPTANTAAAVTAAKRSLSDAGVTGQVQVTDGGSRIQVTTEEKYDPVFLGLVGMGRMTVTGHAVAGLVSRVQG